METLSLALLGLTLLCHALLAQTTPSPEMAAADALFKASKWAEAATAYEAIVKANAANARAWHQLAMSRYSLKQFAPAAEAFQKNIALTEDPSDMYNLACVFSLAGKKDDAMTWLTKAIHHPKTIVQMFNLSDPDLQSLKDDARFKSLNEEVERKKTPCLFSAECGQFDFWIGDWDVYNPQGRKDGTNLVQRFANGCALLENWQAALDSDGKSINFYDPETRKWYQYWMGGDGHPHRYEGEFKDGAMRFEGELVQPNGVKVRRRLTFFNLDPNTVRQFSERSTDGGKTWQVNFDYKYVRKAAARKRRESGTPASIQ
jgi:tetratricopeptide (TPR) repeat protein